MSIVKSTACLGVFPSDIVIRTAIKTGFAELRAQPWLLDFALQAFIKDGLTIEEYGAKTLESIRDWFLANDIKITLGYKINNISIPHVAIWLGEQVEAEATTADVHDLPAESIPWIMATDPVLTFTASSYDKAAGLITVPDSKPLTAVFAGQRVYDRANGRAFEILEVSGQVLRIAADSELNLTNAQVVNINSLWRVALESIVNRETFHIDCVVQGDSVKCIILHALVRWILNRGKQRLLEGRGFERTTINSAGVMIAADGDNAAQIMFKRQLTLTGYTREYWPKDVRAPIQGIQPGLKPGGGEVELTGPEEEQGWGADGVLGS